MKQNSSSLQADIRIMSPQTFANLGGGKLAYIRAMTSEDATFLFPELEEQELAPGIHLWALLNADGSPIMLSDSRDAVLYSAQEQNLETQVLH